jgi:hypothetical protein
MAALRLSRFPPVRWGWRIAGGVLGAGLCAFALWVAYLSLGIVPILLADPPDSVTSIPGWLWGWLVVLVRCLGLPAAAIAGVLGAIRARDTLDGTVLSVRGVFRSQSVDLALARVGGEVTDDVNEKGVAKVTLVARMPGSEREVRLDLGDSGGLLPRPQLTALADAIAAGDPGDVQRRAVVERLRLYVRQPLAVPRYLWADPPSLRKN